MRRVQSTSTFVGAPSVALGRRKELSAKWCELSKSTKQVRALFSRIRKVCTIMHGLFCSMESQTVRTKTRQTCTRMLSAHGKQSHPEMKVIICLAVH